MKPEDKELLRNILLVTVVFLAMFIIWKLREPGLKEHNKYQCAVLGYYEDCKTPLKEEDKLK